jgi:hypothetical protein
MREAFYLDMPWWRAAVYARATEFVMRATRVLHN